MATKEIQATEEDLSRKSTRTTPVVGVFSQLFPPTPSLVNLDILMMLPPEEMEQFFQLKREWGSDHSLFVAPLQRYARHHRFDVGFRGNCQTVKVAFCRFKGCQWNLQWNFSHSVEPPGWIVHKFDRQHSEDCCKNSAEDIRSIKVKSRSMNSQDIARLIAPEVRKIGEPS